MFHAVSSRPIVLLDSCFPAYSLYLSIISVFLIPSLLRIKAVIFLMSGIPADRFIWLVSFDLSCPTTVLFGPILRRFRYILFLLYQPLSISENPFDQCYQWLGFGLPPIPLSFFRYDL
jgi:hypothetical protein